MTKVILASTSRIRGQILTGAGVPFDTESPQVDETVVKADYSQVYPREIAALLADRKAEDVSARVAQDALVIGADQTLELNGKLFDKVDTIEEARARLRLLRDETHNLHAAVSLARGGAVFWRETVTVSLTMRRFSDAWLDGYLERNPGILSSVGCYQLESEGVQLFSRIDGDYFAILGLPLMGLLGVLREEGVLGS